MTAPPARMEAFSPSACDRMRPLGIVLRPSTMMWRERLSLSLKGRHGAPGRFANLLDFLPNTAKQTSDVDMRKKRTTVTDVIRELERGRESYERRAWADAHQALSRADSRVPLAADDLELLAMSAYLIARDDEYLGTLERAYNAYMDEGASVRAARCAFWLGLRLLFRGETGRASGWLSRSRRLIECEEGDCVEEGYLLLPVVEEQLDAGNSEAAYAIAADACEIGNRFGETDW